MAKIKHWSLLTKEEVIKHTKTTLEGITSAQAKKSLQTFGPNALPEKEGESAFHILLSQFLSPLIYVLLIAAAVSFFLGEHIDGVVILVAVVLNTIVGFWQEFKANNAIKHLQQLMTFQVRIVRDGKELMVDSKELVPGDLVLLSSGDKVTADARIISEKNLQVNEASLTGESMPIKKTAEVMVTHVGIGDRKNMVHMGTVIVQGKAKAIVVATGVKTELGHIANLVEETESKKTPLQEQLVNVSTFLTKFIAFLILVIFIVGLYRGLSMREMISTSAALAVSAIPEGLLVALTIVLAVGMQRILKRKALIRKLVAAETLGSVTTICSDKTGTITEGKMQVDQIFLADEQSVHKSDFGRKSHQDTTDVLVAMALANNAAIKNPEEGLKKWEVLGDSTDAALLIASTQAGFGKPELEKRGYKRLDEIPFDESYKLMASLNEQGNDRMIFVKGAPEVVLSQCTFIQRAGKKQKMSAKRLKGFDTTNQELAGKGLRVLAIAKRSPAKSMKGFSLSSPLEDLEGLTFMGFVALKDPIREEVKESFQLTQQAGIRTIIITGDHKYTAKSIAEELGMRIAEKDLLEGDDIEAMSDEDLAKAIKTVKIFARVAPVHKLRIVQALHATNEVVAMLGDGVNDAPALKAADIGVALGSGTDVAKEISDMILLDDNFSVVEAAVEEGRVIFSNIRKIFLYLILDAFTGVGLITLSLFFGLPLPLTAVQILWINIISDSFPNLALTLERAEKGVMQKPPRDKNEPIVNQEVKVLIAAISIIVVTAVFGVYWYILNQTGDIDYSRSLIFNLFAIDSLIYVFSVKSLSEPIWKTNPFSNYWLLIAVGFSLALQIMVTYTPFFQSIFKTVALGQFEWGLIIGLGLFEIMIIEAIKAIYRRRIAK